MAKTLARSRLVYISTVVIVMMGFMLLSICSEKNNSKAEATEISGQSSETLGMAYIFDSIERSQSSQHSIGGNEPNNDEPALQENSQSGETAAIEESPTASEESSHITDSDSETDEPEKKHVKMKFKRVALTFDDGPHPRNTEKILALLKEYDAKATFFMLGSNVQYYPEIAKKVVEEGHELGNHTWSHKNLTAIGAEEIEEEVETTNAIIEEVTGVKPTVFRPPYGATNEQVQTAVKMTPVMWTVDTLDWKSRDPDAILGIVQANVDEGSIVLLHDIHDTTVEALETILQYLDKEGYHFVTISDLEKY